MELRASAWMTGDLDDWDACGGSQMHRACIVAAEQRASGEECGRLTYRGPAGHVNDAGAETRTQDFSE